MLQFFKVMVRNRTIFTGAVTKGLNCSGTLELLLQTLPNEDPMIERTTILIKIKTQ